MNKQTQNKIWMIIFIVAGIILIPSSINNLLVNQNIFPGLIMCFAFMLSVGFCKDILDHRKIKKLNM